MASKSRTVATTTVAGDDDHLPNVLGGEDAGPVRPAVDTAVTRAIEAEINAYAGLPLLPVKEDPLEWWRNRVKSKEFKYLSRAARKFLSAPCSSIESERLFSTGGNIYEPSRNRLLPENAEKLLFCYYNLRSANFKY